MDKTIEEKVPLWQKIESLLKGSERRQYMGQVVNELGRGGQSFAEKVLGWNRGTIRKGQAEVSSGQPVEDRFNQRGRKKAEEHFPNLLEDIREVVEPSCQTDPTFRSTRIYSPLTADEIRLRLIRNHGYKDAELPTSRTLRRILNDLDFHLKKVRKCHPKKKGPRN